MRDLILDILDQSIHVTDRFIRKNADLLLHAARMMAERLTCGNKILIFGNGGSAADAQHIAAEFVNRFRIERPPLSAIALTTDTSILTSIGNDYGFDDVFSKQVLALGRAGDIALGISTSGDSPNVIKALKAAREIDLITMGLAGQGGKIGEVADILFSVDSNITARVQETHIIVGHVLCELVDRILYPEMFRP